MFYELFVKQIQDIAKARLGDKMARILVDIPRNKEMRIALRASMELDLRLLEIYFQLAT